MIMWDKVIQLLDRVLELQAEKMAALQIVHSAETRTLGRRQVAVTEADKQAMTIRIRQYFNRQIADIYQAINRTTKMANPFEERKM